MFISEGSQWVGKQVDGRREHEGNSLALWESICKKTNTGEKKKDRLEIILLIFLDSPLWLKTHYVLKQIRQQEQLNFFQQN